MLRLRCSCRWWVTQICTRGRQFCHSGLALAGALAFQSVLETEKPSIETRGVITLGRRESFSIMKGLK